MMDCVTQLAEQLFKNDDV